MPQALTGAPVGARVAIVGAGGIGFDVARYLCTMATPAEDLAHWRREWGVGDPAQDARAGWPRRAAARRRARQVHAAAAQGRTAGPAGLGKTTGWIHRARLAARGVAMQGGVNYEEITPRGLRITHGPGRERPELLEVDTVVLCAGQEPNRALADDLRALGSAPHVIGGADVATELDAKRAIDQGSRLAARI
jgi:2,4-dienoyl-CoA reductase (NADPH2)